MITASGRRFLGRRQEDSQNPDRAAGVPDLADIGREAGGGAAKDASEFWVRGEGAHSELVSK